MTFASIVGEATKLITSFILWFPLFFFVWMVADIIWTSNNPERRKQAGARLTWGIIAMFIFISIGGIIAVLNQTFFSSGATITTAPSGTPAPSPSPSPAPSPAPSPSPTPSGGGSGGTGGSSNCFNMNGALICQPASGATPATPFKPPTN
ncbi:MAG: hypothetical protein KGI73_00100 [Patescibacteria group bacterium]|nr:hypothetical protein [Patescibacteria group bacterium]